MVVTFAANIMVTKQNNETQPSPTYATIPQLRAMLAKVDQKTLSDSEWLIVKGLLTLVINIYETVCKRAGISQVRELLFGAIRGKQPKAADKESKEEESKSSSAAVKVPKPRKKLPPGCGHGRHSADDYINAKLVQCIHEELKIGGVCPDNLCTGHLQDYYKDSPFIRLDAQAPIGATRYEQEILRCSDCLRCYTAKLPEGIPAEKYSASADAAIVLYRYGFSIPFYRLAKLQTMYGIPLAASVMWARAEFVAQCLLPVFLHLYLKVAPLGETLYHDDTRVRILYPLPSKIDDRTGLFTSGMVVEYEDHKIAIYRSGRNHCGENAAELLKRRPSQLDPIKKMSDAANTNTSAKIPAIIFLCLAHSRGKFKKIKKIFPDECKAAIDIIGQVYDYEEQTQQMTKAQRLAYHQEHSLPLLEKLRLQMQEQLDNKDVEPVSSLGGAYYYFLDHFKELTQFTRILGAPLDNNICERILRLAALHRKNSLFYQNDYGAFVGDLCMSLITSCQLNEVDPNKYLITIIEQATAARFNPAAYLPWNYPKPQPVIEVEKPLVSSG
jgi:hypothetical protein